MKACRASLHRVSSESAALVGLHLSRQCFVVGGRGDHGHVFEVLGRRSQHGRPADVDVLHQLTEGDARLAGGLLEGIKIHHHHVDGFDSLRRHSRPVFLAVPHVQDAPMDLGMQRLYPAIQHLGEAGKVGNIAHRKPGFAQGPSRAAGRNQLHVHGGQLAGEIYQACLIRNAQKGPFYLLIFHARPALFANS